MRREKKILHQQMELLAENSKSCSYDDLPRYSSAIAELFKSLALYRILLSVIFFDLSIYLIKFIHKLFRRKTG